MQATLAAKANDEAARLKNVAENGPTELKQSLRQEHDRAEALAKELSTARAKISAYEAQARQASEDLNKAAKAENDAVELRKSLQKERQRAEQLEWNLTSAKHDLDKLTALAAKANDEANRLKEIADNRAPESEQSLRQEHESAEKLITARAKLAVYEPQGRRITEEPKVPRDLAPKPNNDVQPVGANAGLVTEGNAPNAGTTGPIGAKQIKVVEVRSEPQPQAGDAADAARLMARASVLLGQGDIGSARIVLERAAERGNAQAAFALAETYDPLILAKWGTRGTRGDATKAGELYAKAEAGGNQQAKQRLDALR
jgi:predicted  nucleic acid-binding Zn-ribbon protein